MSFSKDRLQRAYNAPAKQQNKIQTKSQMFFYSSNNNKTIKDKNYDFI